MSLPKALVSWETHDILKRWEKVWKRAGIYRQRPLSFAAEAAALCGPGK